MKKTIMLLGLMLVTCGSGKGGCSDADVASRNLSEAAQNFEIPRRTVFFNGITDKYLLVIEGYCSVDHAYEGKSKTIAVVCMKGPKKYVKHYLGLSDNVSYFTEQLEPTEVSTKHYRVIFKPSVIIPDIELK